MYRRRAYLVALVFTAVLGGCGNGGVQTEPQPLTVLRYSGGSGLPTALLEGTVKFRGRCTWLDDEFGFAYVVLWPSNTDLRMGPSNLPEVVVGDAHVMEGSRVTLGGGEQKDQGFVSQRIGGAIPGECQSERQCGHHSWSAFLCDLIDYSEIVIHLS